MSTRTHAFGVLMLALLLASPRTATASRTFPAVVKDEWQIPGGEPACTLCHQTLDGGFGTATKPFGRALSMNGATAVDTGALKTALHALEAAHSDVDGDGVLDIDELQMGTDPDVGMGMTAGPVDDFPIPRTGCSMVAGAVGAHGPSLLSPARLTASRRSPTVGPTSGAGSQSRRISGDAFLVCGLVLGFVSRRLRLQRKRVASATR